MKSFFAFALLLVLLLTEAQAAQILKVARLDSRGSVQLFFTFDQPPKFSTFINNRRLDVIFSASTISNTMELFPPDEEIVKILPRTENGDLILSLFFRYKPQNFKVSTSSDGKIVCEILLGNEFSKTYQELSQRLKGVQQLDRVPVDFTNPYIQIPYKDDWTSFFSTYEPPLRLEVPVQFTLPPFPIVRFLPPDFERNLHHLPEETMALAEKGAWSQLADAILAKLPQTTDAEQQKLLALTLGDALFHGGDFDGAYRQLYLLKERYPEELLGSYADFLLISLKAKYQDASIAEYELQALETAMGKNSAIGAYLYLAQLESALASAKYKRFNDLLLRDDVALPDDVYKRVRIMHADYWHATDQPVKAFAAYRLHEQSDLLHTMPYSLNGYCTTLYQQKKFMEAAKCYQQLEGILTDKELLGLITYRKNMSRLRTGSVENSSLINAFAQIEAANPASEAGLRAALKKTDLVFLQNKEKGREALSRYVEIAEAASGRAVREEALIKQAIIQSRLGDQAASINLLQQLLREFQSGDVRISAQALMIDILPAEIKRLVEAKEYLQALVLAKKNRELFQKNWINNKFLADIAQAYQRVGLFEEAHKLYLYLIEVSSPDLRERYFLPMISATFDQGGYSLVEDYSSQYVYNYPNGEDSEAILLLRLRALIADERFDEALRLLPEPIIENQHLLTVSATIHFRKEDYTSALRDLKQLETLVTPLPDRENFMLAEALYRSEEIVAAEAHYKQMTADHPYFEQSLFRLAEIERSRGNERLALSLFAKIVETAKNPLWKKYAERELQFAKLRERR
jgi:tetratricopeptide (TPR) repeat protein